MSKKLLAILMSVLLLCTTVPLGAISVSAATTGTYNGMTYEIVDGEITITGCDPQVVTGDWVIPSEIEGYPVKIIGSNVGYGNHRLTSVIISEGVSTIESHAFDYCTSLSSVTLPVSVTFIDAWAFNCGSLTDVYYAGSETDRYNIVMFGFAMLNYATWHYNFGVGLQYEIADGEVTITGYTDELPADLHIPESIKGYPVTKIDERAFYFCSTIERVTIPCYVEHIGKQAFNVCYNLYAIEVVANNQYYCSQNGVLYNKDQSALIRCPSAIQTTTIDIPDSVSDIGYGAFEHCTELVSINIPDSVTTIGEYAFLYCTSLPDVTIPKNVTVLETYVLSGCNSLNSFVIPDNVITINENAFTACENLTSVIVGDGVNMIGWGAFSSCSNLTSITLSNSVTYITNWAFMGCNSLTDVYYKGNETDRANIAIGSNNGPILNATWHYAKVDEPEIPAGLLYEIVDGEVTITGYTDELPAELVIPEAIEGYPVTSIQCNLGPTIAAVTIPSSVSVIANDAFRGCSALTDIFVATENAYYSSKDGVLFSKDRTVLLCHPSSKKQNLSWYRIPDGVTTIVDYAFENCTINSVTIPYTVKEIGTFAFRRCTNLTAFFIPDGNPYFAVKDDVLFNSEMTKLIQYPAKKSGIYSIPDGVITIGAYAFFECLDITEVIIPDSVEEISDAAFAGCSALTTVHLPSSVKKICMFGFLNNYYLSNVYYSGSREDKASISTYDYNDSLLNATWYYAADPISTIVTHSVMDTENGNGLAFRFEMNASGVARQEGSTADFSNATIQYLGTECKLVAAGAIITNHTDFAINKQMTLEYVNGTAMTDTPAVYLQDVTDASFAFAVRVINIPDTALNRTIYARPYYIVEVRGKEIVVYGDVDFTTCAQYM